jgi:hypothetical protein
MQFKNRDDAMKVLFDGQPQNPLYPNPPAVDPSQPTPPQNAAMPAGTPPQGASPDSPTLPSLQPRDAKSLLFGVPTNGSGSTAAPALTSSDSATPVRGASQAATGGNQQQPNSASPSPNSVLTADQFAQQNPDAYKAYLPARPTSDFDPNTPHPTLRHALSALFAGMAEFGRPGQGAAMVNRWNQQNENERDYDANLPKLKSGAIAQAFNQYLSQQNEASTIGERNANTKRLLEGITPEQEAAQNLHDKFVQRWTSNVDPDANSFVRYTTDELNAAPPSVARMVAPHLGAIIQMPQQSPNFKISNGTAEPLLYRGQSYGLTPSPNEPAEVTQARNAAIGSLKQNEIAKMNPIVRGQLESKYGDLMKLDAPTFGKAMNDGEAITTRMSAAPKVQIQQGQQNFALAKEARGQINDAEKTYRNAKEAGDALDGFIQLAQSGNKEAAATVPLEGTLRIVTSQGVKRINRTEVQGVEGAGSLFDMIQAKVGKLTSGQPVPPDLLEDFKALNSMLTNKAYQQYSDHYDQARDLYEPEGVDFGKIKKLAAPGGPSGASGTGHIIKVDGKRYQYNGTGATDDMKNYTKLAEGK